MRIPLFSLAAVCIAPLAVAQGTVDYGPLGCTATCATQNDPVPGFTARTLANEYAHAVQLSTAVTIGAFSVYTESVSGGPETVQTALYLDAGSGVPDVLPVAEGTLTVDGPLGWYTTVLDPPIQLAANALCFLGVDTNAIRPPDVGAGGATPPAPSFWRRPPFGGTAWAQTGIIQSPIYRVHCIEMGSGVSTMTAATPPTMGTNFDLLIHGNAAGMAAALNVGASDTAWGPNVLPYRMGPLGAPGCSILVSPDVSFTVMPNPAAGPLPFSLPIPMDATLQGMVLFFQAAALNPGANALGLNPTNEIIGTIG